MRPIDCIRKINRTALEDFNKAQGMLEMYNMIAGEKLGWFNCRVVEYDKPNGSVAEKYSSFHDIERMYERCSR